MMDYLVLELEEQARYKQLREARAKAELRREQAFRFGSLAEVYETDAEVGTIIWEIRKMESTAHLHWMSL